MAKGCSLVSLLVRYLNPSSFFEEGFFVVFLFDVVVVALVKVFVFFLSAAAVFDFSDDDLFAVCDVPVERVAFFPVEGLEDVVGDLDVVVFRVGILLNRCRKVHHLKGHDQLSDGSILPSWRRMSTKYSQYCCFI
jgi:hypothetical protein